MTQMSLGPDRPCLADRTEDRQTDSSTLVVLNAPSISAQDREEEFLKQKWTK